MSYGLLPSTGCMLASGASSRCQGGASSFLRRRGILLLPLLLVLAVSETFGQEKFLAQHATLIQRAAQSAMDVYVATQETVPADAILWESSSTTKRRAAHTAALLTQDDAFCYFSFRGGAQEEGFAWVREVNTRVSHVASADQPSKRCPVVAEYKRLVRPKKKSPSYAQDLMDAAKNCVGKQVLLAGHDLGGAMAVMYGLGLEQIKASLWIVTFGQPPVFSPKQTKLRDYVESSPPGLLKFKAARKSPCPYLNYKQYVPIVNTESLGADPASGKSLGLGYDFMYYLNVVFYGLIASNSSGFILDADDCLTAGAAQVETAMSTVKRRRHAGNAGAPYGQFVLLPPSSFPTVTATVPSYALFRYRHEARRDRIFGTSSFPVTLSMLLFPGSSSCEDSLAAHSVHGMATYLAKVLAMTNVPNDATFVTGGGFTPNSACNYDDECKGDDTCDGLVCVDSDRRPVRPGMMVVKKNK